MKRVVITGFGAISSIGNNKEQITQSLKTGQSGVEYNQEYADLGLRSHVYAPIRADIESIDRKLKRFMGDSAAYAYLSMAEAITHAGLNGKHISDPKTGLIVGSGGISSSTLIKAADILRNKGARRVKSTEVPRVMASGVSACLATAYQIKGLSYSISSACATSAHCVGNAYEIVRSGQQNIIFAGGGEEVSWSNTFLFDSMLALSSAYNDKPAVACRPYDQDRDGFVMSGGGGIIVLEELQYALRRNAEIYAEIVGYGATSDGDDMVKPSGEGAARCMQQALATVDTPIDYINTHATSTPLGDIIELNAIKQVFGDKLPKISSTKSITGHGLGVAGVNEAIYSLLMMEHDFISASANIEKLDEGAAGMPIITTRQDKAGLNTVMSNSFGFGGTNASLVFKRFSD